MNRVQLDKYITDTYGITAERLFEKYPGFQVYRHSGTKKWFAMIMDIPRSRLGLKEEAPIDIVNFKCDPLLIGSLRMENGFFAAYHMNKENWITAALDGSAPDDKIKMLTDMSYELTMKKPQRKRNR